MPCYGRFVVPDWGGTYRVRCLSLVPGQTVEAYPGTSSNGQISRQDPSADVRSVAVVVSPVLIAPVLIAPVPVTSVVRVCIHDARLGNYDRSCAATTGAGCTTTGAGCTITGCGATSTGGGGATIATGNGSPNPTATCTPPACAESGRARLATAMQVTIPKVRRSVFGRCITLSSCSMTHASVYRDNPSR